jgi:hypothetical protein
MRASIARIEPLHWNHEDDVVADHGRPRYDRIGGSDAEPQADDDGEYVPQSHLPSTGRVR